MTSSTSKKIIHNHKICINCNKNIIQRQNEWINLYEKRKFCNYICRDEYKIGEKSNNWKGGRVPILKLIRNSRKYIRWRTEVYKRDNYICQISRKKGNGDLNVHHIISLSELFDKYNITSYTQAIKEDNLWNISNGITILESLHKELHSTFGKTKVSISMAEFKDLVCKKCKRHIRKSLSMCKDCLDKHNKSTVALKRKYRKEGKCCMCGLKSNGKRLCEECAKKHVQYEKDSLFINSKKMKYSNKNILKQIGELI